MPDSLQRALQRAVSKVAISSDAGSHTDQHGMVVIRRRAEDGALVVENRSVVVFFSCTDTAEDVLSQFRQRSTEQCKTNR